MQLAEIFGYLASVLVFATFYMRSMMQLRVVAIASNLAFITYGALDGLTPILILHVALLPLNILRLTQIREFLRQVEKAARENFSAQAIVPLMQRRKIQANAQLFAAGDVGDELYYVSEGTLLLPEIQHQIGSGNFLGEFALFSASNRRTTSAIAQTDCTLMVLTRTALFSALLQHPRLAIHLLKLITARLTENAGQKDASPAPSTSARSSANDTPKGFLHRRYALPAAAIVAFLVLIAMFNPLYSVLNRDAVITAWANVATAPISGTVEDLVARPGERVADASQAARVVNANVDRSGVITAAAAIKRAEMRLGRLNDYKAQAAALTGDNRLDEMRTALELREAEQDLQASKATFAEQEKNLDAVSNASIKVPAGMTIWSTAVSNGRSVLRGERLFTWVDCSRLLVDIPTSRAMAALTVNGMRAEVMLEGERAPRAGTVILNRDASGRLVNAELIDVPGVHRSDAQVVVALGDSASVAGCPIGRRAFVRFPDIGFTDYLRTFVSPQR